MRSCSGSRESVQTTRKFVPSQASEGPYSFQAPSATAKGAIRRDSWLGIAIGCSREQDAGAVEARACFVDPPDVEVAVVLVASVVHPSNEILGSIPADRGVALARESG